MPGRDAAHRRLVVDHEHPTACRAPRASCGKARRGATPSTSGSRTSKLAPRAGALPSRIEPPWDSTMPYATASPRPVPFPRGFVVKNGSKMRSRSASSTPIPVSVTRSAICGGGPATSSVSIREAHRPPGMASRAFRTRFRSTCSSSPASPETVLRAAAERSLDLDAPGERARRQRDDLGDDLVQVDRPARAPRAGAEAEELAT